MLVEQVVPRAEAVDLDGLLARLRAPEARLPPFDSEAVEVCSRVSTALFRDLEARKHPELQALAFWMRKAELERMRTEFAALETERVLLAPRGLVFHVPPSNVDTIFLYSWVLSMLAGNANVIRLSERAGAPSAVICRLLNAVLRESGELANGNTAVLRYGHERSVNEAISAAADVRVIWGGDETVNMIRSVPLPPHAQELTFPDRYSLAVIKAGPWLGLAAEERQGIAEQFFNDTYWFDQMACSSPRVVIWCGQKADCAQAGSEFYRELAAEIERKGYALPAGPRLNKLTFAYRAILDEPVVAVEQAGPECTVLSLDEVSGFPREHCGGGLLFQVRIENLLGMVQLIQHKDQTLTYFGFDGDELRALVRVLNGRGIDRIVPIGHALNFHRFWDGYDLLRSFTRAVYVEG